MRRCRVKGEGTAWMDGWSDGRLRCLLFFYEREVYQRKCMHIYLLHIDIDIKTLSTSSLHYHIIFSTVPSVCVSVYRELLLLHSHLHLHLHLYEILIWLASIYILVCVYRRVSIPW